jgi:hypothetical protein
MKKNRAGYELLAKSFQSMSCHLISCNLSGRKPTCDLEIEDNNNVRTKELTIL